WFLAAEPRGGDRRGWHGAWPYSFSGSGWPRRQRLVRPGDPRSGTSQLLYRPLSPMITAPLAAFLSTGDIFWAHVSGPRAGGELMLAWTLDPLLLTSLALVAWAYRRGVRRLWSRMGAGRGLRRWEVRCFW